MRPLRRIGMVNRMTGRFAWESRACGLLGMFMLSACGTSSFVETVDAKLYLLQGTERLLLAGRHRWVSSRQSGMRTYATGPMSGSAQQAQLIVCDGNNRVRHHVVITEDSIGSANAVMGVRFIGSGKMIVDYHMNPSSGYSVVVDPRTGDQTSYFGALLTADPSGSDFAYVTEPPHFAPNWAGLLAKVYVNDRAIGSIPRNSTDSIRWSEETESFLLELDGGKRIRLNRSPDRQWRLMRE
jgi:hypothetical protein